MREFADRPLPVKYHLGFIVWRACCFMGFDTGVNGAENREPGRGLKIGDSGLGEEF